MYKEISKKIGMLFFILFIGIIVVGKAIVSNPDNDMWWMMSTGRYIVENKEIPTTNPFVIHEGFGMIVQQWSLAIVNYLLYNYFGKWGLVIFALVSYGINIFLVYWLVRRYTIRRSTIALCIGIGMLLCGIYLNTRPTQLTILILLLEQLIILNYKRHMNYKWGWLWLCILPALSLIEVNIQAALWLYLFIMVLPHITPNFLNKEVSTWNQLKEKKAFFLPLVVSVCVGFLNPNGVNGVSYLMKSYNSGDIMKVINEMKSPELLSMFGVIIIVAIVLLTIYIYAGCAKKDMTYAYMLCGGIILAIMHVRNIWVLLFGMIPVICELSASLKKVKNYGMKEGVVSNSKLRILEILVIIMSSVLYLLFIYIEISAIKSILADAEKPLPICAAAYLDNNVEASDIVLYTDFNSGGYMEWCGFDVYIDARPELFQEKINGKENIAEEYVGVYTGKADYNGFIQKYSFTHILAEKESYFDIYLSVCSEYCEVVSDNKYVLYEKIGR